MAVAAFSEEPDRPTETSRGDTAAEDEPGEWAVSPEQLKVRGRSFKKWLHGIGKKTVG